MMESAAALALGLTFMVSPAQAERLTTADLQSICKSGTPVCGMYLSGIYDGIQVATHKAALCPPSEPSREQLKDYFQTTVIVFGKDSMNDPAAIIATTAFKMAMPCR